MKKKSSDNLTENIKCSNDIYFMIFSSLAQYGINKEMICHSFKN